MRRRPWAGVTDHLAVNIGTELLGIVPGRVSTEVDAHLSYDTQATIDKVRRLFIAIGCAFSPCISCRTVAKCCCCKYGDCAARSVSLKGVCADTGLEDCRSVWQEEHRCLQAAVHQGMFRMLRDIPHHSPAKATTQHAACIKLDVITSGVCLMQQQCSL